MTSPILRCITIFNRQLLFRHTAYTISPSLRSNIRSLRSKLEEQSHMISNLRVRSDIDGKVFSLPPLPSPSASPGRIPSGMYDPIATTTKSSTVPDLCAGFLIKPVGVTFIPGSPVEISCNGRRDVTLPTILENSP